MSIAVKRWNSAPVKFMKTKRWVIEPDRQPASDAWRVYGYKPLAAQVLAARGIVPENAAQYLDCGLTGLYDPLLMTDLQTAVDFLQEAVAQKEPIVVYGDYDVDGVTSTYILMDYLQSKHAVCSYYIPNRLQEGYGLTEPVIRKLSQQGAKLLITVDCGITAAKEIELANRLGMKTIVTDHHECHGELPPADAIVDYKRSDCAYPFAHLAGVGVVFKLLCALEGDTERILRRYAEFIALGTIADVMPLVQENRIIVAAGLRQMAQTNNVGLRTLLRQAGMEHKKISSASVSFVLAPRLNAAGRMGCPELAVDLLLTKDETIAQSLTQTLCEQNKQRQIEENKILEEVSARLRREYNPLKDKMIVLAGRGWHQGVLGIVCSRLCDRYHHPVILISVDENGNGNGSGRSIRGFHLFQALASCSDLLERYGGHELAVGLTVSAHCIPALRQRLYTLAQQINNTALVPQLHIDGMIAPEHMTLEHMRGLSILEPYGVGNEEPVFCMQNMLVEEITPISSDHHVRLTLKKDNKSWTAIWFGVGAGGLRFVEGNIVDAAFHLEQCERHGKKSVLLSICDIRLSSCEQLADQKLLNIYHTYMTDGPLTAKQARILLPDRADLVAVWRHIICRAEGGQLSVPDSALSRRVAWESRRDINIGKLFVCLDIFSESGLISYHFKERMLHILLKPYQGKANISGSVVLATLQSMAG